MNNTQFPTNPIQVSEMIIDQSLKAIQTVMGFQEQGDAAVRNVLENNARGREAGLKMVELVAQTTKQNNRMFFEMMNGAAQVQMDQARRFTQATVEDFNNRVETFSKS